MGTRRHPAAGFTLLEMVLVLFLMALVASAGLMLTEGVEDQAKYDETKRRMEIIRKAIVGDPTRTVNGSPEISGFVADMGRLPKCLAELLALGEPVSGEIDKYESACKTDSDQSCEETPDTCISKWNIDDNTGIGSGWRGPYIAFLPDRDGVRRFRDGYGNVDIDKDEDARNFGWNWAIYDEEGRDDKDPAYTLPAISIRIQSEGLDLNDEHDNYPAGAFDDSPLFINGFDYQANFQDWGNIEVAIDKIDSAPITGKHAVKLRLAYPGGVIDSDESIDVLGQFEVSSGDSASVPAGSSFSSPTLTVGDAGDVVLTISGVDYTIPVSAGASLTVPSGTTFNDLAYVLTFASGEVSFSHATVFPMTVHFNLTLPDDFLPQGRYALLLICHDPSNPNSVDGKRFDGDCSRYGSDAAPVAYAPRNRPYFFTALPRALPIMPPSPLNWAVVGENE